MEVDDQKLNLEKHSLRPMKCELNNLSKPDGSAFLTMGKTGTIAAVYGPIEVKPQKIIIDRATIEVLFRPKLGMIGVKDKAKEQELKNTCEAALVTALHPRTCISLVIQELQDNGGLLACCINAGMMALLSSGLPMNFFVAAVSCIVTEDKKIIIDPSLKQVKKPEATFTFAFESISKEVVAVHTSGNPHLKKTYVECLEKCRDASENIFQYYREIVQKYSEIL